MKTIASISICALLMITLATPWSTSAESGGPSASGTYRFVLEDDFSKYVEFSARSDERGTTTGQMTFRDEAGGSADDPDGENRSERQPAEFFMTANLNSLKIENNRALLGGTVADSSDRRYIGRWIQLVVEDNSQVREMPDKLSWCFCQPDEGGWVPADAELREDDGAWWKWWATDYDREDDRGVHSVNIIPGNKKSCSDFPLTSYEFAEVRIGEGRIQVRP